MHDRKSQTSSESERPKDPKDRACLLLVDDDPNVCRALSRLFRPLGFRTVIAHDADQALNFLSGSEVNIIITDMRMPGKSGKELLEEVSQKYPNIHRILLTGYADLKDTTSAIQTGLVDDLLTKPWEVEHIEACVLKAQREPRDRETSNSSTSP